MSTIPQPILDELHERKKVTLVMTNYSIRPFMVQITYEPLRFKEYSLEIQPYVNSDIRPPYFYKAYISIEDIQIEWTYVQKQLPKFDSIQL